MGWVIFSPFPRGASPVSWGTPTSRGRIEWSSALRATRRRCARGAIAIAALGQAGASASRQILSAPRPAWVVPVSAPDPASKPVTESSGGTDFLLLDLQTNEASTPCEAYTHLAVHILNEQGVEPASQISDDFDPSYQTFIVHDVAIHRDGQRIDRLDLRKWRALHREPRLEYQIYDGRLTALLLLEDVRVGDVVEYSYTVRGEN